MLGRQCMGDPVAAFLGLVQVSAGKLREENVGRPPAPGAAGPWT